MALKITNMMVSKPVTVLLVIGFPFFCASGQNLNFENGKVKAVSFEKPAEKVQTVNVYLQDSTTPLLGTFSETEKLVTFKPALPFQSGKSYKLTWNGAHSFLFSIPESSSGPPQVKAVYPEQDTLPENLLKMYIVFDQPMQANTGYQHIEVYNDQKRITPFLELQPELWNYDNTILTLWLDPGRIKKDLLRNQKLGKPLTEGESYTLVISSNWKSQTGKQLTKSFEKKFVISKKDTERPVPKNWKFEVSEHGSRNPLTIHFGEPLDHQLLAECFQIKNQTGTFSISNKDQSISFIPDTPWKTGTYELTIESRLEDLAGNNLNRVFDRDIQTQEKTELKTFSLAFTIE